MDSISAKIFIMDDDEFFSNIIKNFLLNNEIPDVHVFNKEKLLLDHLEENPDLIIIDHFLENTTGLEMMEIIKLKKPKTQFIYLSSQEYYHIAIKAMKQGALDYIEKNQRSFEKLKGIIKTAVDRTDNFRNLSSILTLKTELLTQK